MAPRFCNGGVTLTYKGPLTHDALPVLHAPHAAAGHEQCARPARQWPTSMAIVTILMMRPAARSVVDTLMCVCGRGGGWRCYLRVNVDTDGARELSGTACNAAKAAAVLPATCDEA